MADLFTLVGMPYTEEDKPSRKSCKIMEIYKLLGRNYKRKYLPDLDKCLRLNTLNNQIDDNRIDFELIKKDLENGVQLLSEDDLDILFDCEEEQQRTGQFQRIFPAPDPLKHKQYLNLFEHKRFNNILVSKFMKQRELLETIHEKIYD